jgi:hypothetical protein
MEWVMDNEMWLTWIRQHFTNEADYASFCWVTDNIEACFGG